MKIIEYSNVTSEGLTLKFDTKFSLHGGISTDVWWLSWDKLCELIDKKL